MRKSVFLVMLALLVFALPTTARAQTGIIIDSMIVQIWPEFDQPSALVISDFRMAADTKFPAALSFRIPADAKVNALAKETTNGLINLEFNVKAEGDWQVVNFNAEDLSAIKLEYYAPLAKNGQTRTYAYAWPGDYAVKAFSVQVQVPTNATNMQTSPKLETITPGGDGFVYHNSAQLELKAGQEYKQDISYDKADDTLSANSGKVQPSGGLEQTTPTQTSFASYLPWILGLVGVVLIFGGVVWYWQTGKSGNTSSRPSRSRRRRARAVEEDDDDDDDDENDGQTYCPQCGKRAQPNDRFCRACGSKIRKNGS